MGPSKSVTEHQKPAEPGWTLWEQTKKHQNWTKPDCVFYLLLSLLWTKNYDEPFLTLLIKFYFMGRRYSFSLQFIFSIFKYMFCDFTATCSGGVRIKKKKGKMAAWQDDKMTWQKGEMVGKIAKWLHVLSCSILETYKPILETWTFSHHFSAHVFLIRKSFLCLSLNFLT